MMQASIIQQKVNHQEQIIDIIDVNLKIQSSPIQSVRSLMMDAFITGFFCGKSKDQQSTIDQTLDLVYTINHQLHENQITFQQKQDLYQTCVNFNKDLSLESLNMENINQQNQTKIQEQQQIPNTQKQQDNNFSLLLVYFFINFRQSRMLSDKDQCEIPTEEFSYVAKNKYQDQCNIPEEFSFIAQNKEEQIQGHLIVEHINSLKRDSLEKKKQIEPTMTQTRTLSMTQTRTMSNTMMVSAMRMGVDCEICYDGLKLNQLFTLTACPHIFHKTCLQEHLKFCINEKNFPFGCPACKVEIIFSDIREILDKQQLDMYENMTLKLYFEVNNKEITHCPTPDCPYAFINADGIENLNCPVCKKRYCLKCKSQPHIGKPCKQVQGGDQQFLDLALNKKFQQCSQCKNYIEKNKGCNHITCRCGYEFCYNCGVKYPGCKCSQTYLQRRARNLTNVVNSFKNLLNKITE